MKLLEKIFHNENTNEENDIATAKSTQALGSKTCDDNKKESQGNGVVNQERKQPPTKYAEIYERWRDCGKLINLKPTN